MSEPLQGCANDTSACCCMDMGTILDGSDCSAVMEVALTTTDEAAAVLERLTQLAQSKSAEPVVVKHEVVEHQGQPLLRASFTFSCQAEALIFQLAAR